MFSTSRTRLAASISTLAIAAVGLAPAAIADNHTGSAPRVDSYLSSPAAKKADNKAIFDRIVKRLPSDWQSRRDAAQKRLGIEKSPAQEMAEAKVAQAADDTTTKAIDPTQYQCTTTALDGYVDSILADVDPTNLFLLSLLGALDIPTYDAILFGSPKDGKHDVLAAYAPSLKTAFGYAQRFWDVQLNDIQLLGMHGDMMTDRNRVAAVVQYMYQVGPADATAIADDIISIVTSDPGLQNGKNPLFTLNAFAFTGKGDPDPVLRKLKDKMVFGDGILAALKAIGLNQVGPRAVLGHEMSHHVQYEDNLFESDLTGPEATRRTELMADGFGTYFVTHKKGLSMTPAQVLDAEQSFYDVGDCQFTSNGHHGTPNQRRAAAAWGAAEVAYANNPNKVLPSLTLAKRFEKVLPKLVAPDAPTTVQGYRATVQ